jgi:hypothetical protein
MSWITFFQIFCAAFITGTFTVLAVWVSQRGAASVVEQTFEGQRVLARDAALRDYRRQQIAPYIEAARQRFRIWSEMHAEVGVGDDAKLRELRAKVTDPDFHSLVVTYVEVPDDAFRAAFQRFVNAEGKLESPYTATEVMDRILQMRLALVELSTASEHYLFLSQNLFEPRLGMSDRRNR